MCQEVTNTIEGATYHENIPLKVRVSSRGIDSVENRDYNGVRHYYHLTSTTFLINSNRTSNSQ